MKPFLLFLVLGAFFHFVPKALALVTEAGQRVLRHFWASLLAIVLLPILVRLALLPRWPIPKPLIHDEFVYLFAADLYSSFRTHLPPDSDSRFFEAVYLLTSPNIASKYPPLQGMILALGQLLAGLPWLGVILSCVAMNLAIAWFLLPWLGRRWALISAFVVGGHLGLASYWMNSYWGGAGACCAAALLLGAWTRFRRRPTVPMGILFAAACTALAASRPYEGALLLGVPLTLHLLYRNGLRIQRPITALLGTALAGAVSLGAYNASITGSPLRLPYMVYAEQYHYVPIFWFQSLSAEPAYSKPPLRITMELEQKRYEQLRSPQGLAYRAKEWQATLDHLLPWVALLLPLPFVGVLFSRSRFRPVLGLLLIGFVGCSLTVFQFSHYFAPFVPLLFLVLLAGLSSVQHHRWFQPLLPAFLLAIAASNLQSIRFRLIPVLAHPVTLRSAVEQELGARDRQQIIFVKEQSTQAPGEILPDWTYNRANFDQAPVLWVNDLGEEENERLIRRWPDREYWRLIMPSNAFTLSPIHPRPGQEVIHWRLE